MPEDYIWIVTDNTLIGPVYEDSTRGESNRNPFGDTVAVEIPNRQGVPVKAEKLEQGITEFLQVLGRVFRNATQQTGELIGMELDEIEITVEINSEGQLSLLGTGGKVGGKGAMKLSFKKVESK